MTRSDYQTVAPALLEAMRRLSAHVDAGSIEPRLRFLVELRISQINGCAYCVDLHAREALSNGESPERVNTVVVWREAPLFTLRERAALAWAEALTLIAESLAPDQVYDEAHRAFSEQELVDLTYVIVTMNVWNRLAIAFRQSPANWAAHDKGGIAELTSSSRK